MTYDVNELDKFIKRIHIKAEESYKLSKVLNGYCIANSSDEGIYEILPVVNRIYSISDELNGVLAYYKNGEIVD